MELRYYLNILERRAIVIFIVAALAVTVVASAGLLTTPLYTTGATVRVMQDVGVLDLRINQTYGEILMNTYGRVLTSWPVLAAAARRLESPLSVAQLRQQVLVEVVPDTELMWIAVEDKDPAFARDLANTLAAILVEYADELYVGSSKSTRQIVEEQLAGVANDLAEDRQKLASMLATGQVGAEAQALSRQITFGEEAYNRLLDQYEMTRLNESLRANSITIIAPAKLPQSPSNGIGLTQIGLGLVVGLFGGVGLALVLENLDTRIHSPQQLESLTRLPVLGMVPQGLLSLGNSEHTNGTGRSKAIEEAYRLLSINLQMLGEDNSVNTILITSAMPREGKSTIAVNLAQALAESGQTVFLVESDLRRPAVAKMLDIDNGLGLGSLLAEPPADNRELLSQIVHPAKQPTLFVIAGGSTPAHPTALLASPAMENLLRYLSTQAQTTLLDAPPVLGMADVSILVQKADGVILVVAEGIATRERIRAALRQLEAGRANVLGLIFLQRGSKGSDYVYG